MKKKTEFSPATFLPFDLTVCMVDISCCGPSIFHMSSSSLQTSSLSSSCQPGTACEHSNTLWNCWSNWAFQAFEIGTEQNKVEPNHQICPFLTPPKKWQRMNYEKHFRPHAPCTTKLGIWWICIRKFRVIVDVLAVLAGAPRSSMQLREEWPAGGSFQSSALRVWPPVLYPSGARLPSKGKLRTS